MVAAGGAIGAALRYAVVLWLGRVAGLGFPWGTLAVNVVGSFAMGCLAALLLERVAGGWGRLAPFLMSGVLGGFTTFSAFSLDVLVLVERGRAALALGYAGASVFFSIAALWGGLVLMRGVLAS